MKCYVVMILLCSYGASVSGEPWIFSDKVVQHFSKSGSELRVNSKCIEHIKIYLDSLERADMWAVEMYDASTKISSGILNGNIVDMGHFDQCLAVLNDTGPHGTIRGQHCIAYGSFGQEPVQHLHPALKAIERFSKKELLEVITSKFYNMDHTPRSTNHSSQLMQLMKFGFAVCLPDSCSPEEVKTEMEQVLKGIDLTMDIYNANEMCSSNKEIKFNAMERVAIISFGVLAFLMVISSIYELMSMDNLKGTGNGNQLLLAFSIISNGKRLMNTDDSGQKMISSLAGIRVIAMLEILLLHRSLNSMVLPHTNDIAISKGLESNFTVLVFGAFFSVDTFLLISGLLVSFNHFKEVVNGSFKPRQFILHRYMRLAPTLAAMILFQSTVAYHLGTGPVWKRFLGRLRDDCATCWWPTIMFAYNYVNPMTGCLPHTWSSCVDMQLYHLAPILLYLLWRAPRAGIWTIVGLIVAVVTLTFHISYTNDLYLSIYASNEKVIDFFTKLYFPTHARADPWLLGFILGYVMQGQRNMKIQINKVVAACAWVCCCTVMVALVYGFHDSFHDPRHEPNPLQDGLANSLGRLIWSICMCWVIYACSCGYGGVVNRLLSNRYLQPASRLTFCIFISHYTIQNIISSQTKTPLYWSPLHFFSEYACDVILIIIGAVILHLMVEAPFSNLENYLHHRRNKTGVDKKDL